MRLLARWYDDGEYWFFEDITGEHDPAYGAFEVEVPDEMATAYLEATKTVARLADDIPAVAGLEPDGPTLVEVCSGFHSSQPETLLGEMRHDYRRCDGCGHFGSSHAEAT